jgi:hemolysin activation/secretion protein
MSANNRKRTRALARGALALFSMAACAPAPAQLPPGGSLGESRPSERPLEMPEPLPPQPPFKLPPVPPPEPAAPLSAGPTLVLRGVRFTGNQAFDDDTLAAVAAPWIGREVSTADLQALRRQLTLHYTEHGYVNSGALLPDQSVADGIVTFTIVEGVLSALRIEGLEHLEADYVARRIRLSTDPPLDANRLRERLQLLVQDPAIERVDAKLGPGEAPGQGELSLQVVEAPTIEGYVGVANDHPPSVGAEGVTGGFLVRHLVGWGESVTVDVERTRGLTDLRAGLAVPIGARDTLLEMDVEHTSSSVVEAPIDQLDIESESTDLGIRLSHPVLHTPTRELRLGIAVERRSSETSLLGRPFSFSAGVVDGHSDVTVLRATQSWVERARDQVLAARSTFSFGVDAFGATINPGGIPDGRFFAWLGQIQWARRLTGGGVELVARAEGQFTPDRLLPLEKIAIGGASTVRGYRENELVRDNGWHASVEVRIPVTRVAVPGLAKGADDGRLYFAPFVDYGRAWDTDVPSFGPTTLLGVGAGLRWRASRDVLATLYLARPLKDVPPGPSHDLQDWGVYFDLSARLR